ncbi:hypothetical protein MMC13_007181 [Lambiella insularis]|nr:hypothetical protein [Lambiella insularis]
MIKDSEILAIFANGTDSRGAHPLHKCYLQFYEALSQELLARSMHELSVNKLPLLHSARESYLVALHSLLEASNVLRHDFTDEQSLPSSPVVSDSTSPPYTPTPAPRRSRFTATITRSPILAASPSSWSFPQKWVSPSQAALAHDPVFGSPLRRPAPLEISRIWLSSSQASLANDPAFGSPVRRPSPLRVLKSVLKTGPFAADGSQTPPLTPPPKRNLQISTPAAITFSASTTSWLHDRALQRYNAHSNDFDQMLHRHVEVVDTLIKSTLEVEAERYQKRPSKSSNGDEGRRLEKRARIEKLKAKEWRRERFRPERYQELCAKALAEL